MAPSAQLGQLNSSSPRALVLPPMKTSQVGHIHRARPAPSLSSSWSHLSVSAIISFRAPALGWAGVSCLRGDAVQAWHCSSWWMRPTYRAQTHLCPLAAIGDACPGVLGEKDAGLVSPAWIELGVRGGEAAVSASTGSSPPLGKGPGPSPHPLPSHHHR